jgi:tetratricopeptide (TPR) repeat protein
MTPDVHNLSAVRLRPVVRLDRGQVRARIAHIVFWFSLASTALPSLAQSSVAPIVSALQAHDFERALKLSQSALTTHPDDYRIWTLQGMASAGIGKLPQALAAYQHALNLSPTYLPALEGAAQTEFQLGREGSRALLLKILAQIPNDENTHMLLGILDYRAANCSDAADHFRKGGRVVQAQPEALTEYGSCLAELKLDGEAEAAFAAALALTPTRYEARYNLALAQWNAHHADEALKTLQPLIESTPADTDALALSADILESKDDTAQAVALLRKALLADPNNVNAYLQFARLSYDHSSPQVGIDILDLGLAQLPQEPRLYLVRGILLTQLGEFAHAADDFETASRIDPRVQFLGVAQGLVKSQQHNAAEALAEFRGAVKAHPKDAYAHYLLAEALSEEGKPAGSPEQTEEISTARRALQLDPTLVAAYDLLSSINIENGQVDQAIKESRTALSLDPSDQQAVYHLIVALRKTGDKDQVPSLLKRLMELRAGAAAMQKSAKHYRLYEDQNGIRK